MKPYLQLTRRGRLRRMHRLAEVALSEYGIPGSRLTFLQYTMNFIYRVDLDSNGRLTPLTPAADPAIYLPDRCLLRIHGMVNAEAVASEMTWLAALNEQAGLPVPAPLSTPDGRLVATILTRAIPQGRLVTLMRWLDGRRLGQGLRPAHLRAMGTVVAQMHSFAAGWQPPADFARPEWDWEAQLGGSEFKTPLDELVASMPLEFKGPFEAVSNEGKKMMAGLGKGADAFGLIHADLYPENVLFKDGRAYPIDFEDCGYGYWMWDIAVALCTWAWTPDWERLRDAFYDGYTQIRSLPQAQRDLLDLFIAIQFATMLLWASAFLEHDPARAPEHIPWRDDSGRRLLSYFQYLEKL